MSFTYNPATSVGRVRLLLSDTDEINPMFTDEEIQAILDDEDGEVKLAAASLIDVIASNVAMVMRRIKLLDLETDGPATAKALREHAKTLREQADDSGSFEIADVVDTVFGERERRFKEWERTGL